MFIPHPSFERAAARHGEAVRQLPSLQGEENGQGSLHASGMGAVEYTYWEGVGTIRYRLGLNTICRIYLYIPSKIALKHPTMHQSTTRNSLRHGALLIPHGTT